VRRYLSVLAAVLLRATAFAGISVPDSLQSILNSDIASEERFRLSHNLIFYNSSPAEAEDLAGRILRPFVQTTWREHPMQLSHRARLELLVSFCYRERGGELSGDGERAWAEKAIRTALESRSDTVCARVFTAAGYMELKRGDARRANEYLYDAICYYERMEEWSMASQMLYVIVTQFYEIQDIEGMERVLAQMRAYLEKDDSAQSHYQYNVILHSYYELLLERQAVPDTASIERMMIPIRANVALVETRLSELDPHWMHAYAYYYLAQALYDYDDRTATDTVMSNLDRAEAMFEREEWSRTNESASARELQIHLDILRAQTLRRAGDSAAAFGAMSRAISLLEGLDDHENLNEMRSKAYAFMADHHERRNPSEALRFQKMFTQNEARRYEKEKLRAVNEMAAKYESEKKQLQIASLTAENRTARQILVLIVVIALVSSSALVLAVLQGRLRRKNTERRLYEIALEAELRQNELNALRSPDHDAQIRRVIEKLTRQITESSLSRDYLVRLRALDPSALDKEWLVAQSDLTAMELRYLVCFEIDMTTADVAALMNIEQASVHTVRYRIRKKFSHRA